MSEGIDDLVIVNDDSAIQLMYGDKYVGLVTLHSETGANDYLGLVDSISRAMVFDVDAIDENGNFELSSNRANTNQNSQVLIKSQLPINGGAGLEGFSFCDEEHCDALKLRIEEGDDKRLSLGFSQQGDLQYFGLTATSDSVILLVAQSIAGSSLPIVSVYDKPLRINVPSTPSPTVINIQPATRKGSYWVQQGGRNVATELNLDFSSSSTLVVDFKMGAADEGWEFVAGSCLAFGVNETQVEFKPGFIVMGDGSDLIESTIEDNGKTIRATFTQPEDTSEFPALVFRAVKTFGVDENIERREFRSGDPTVVIRRK